MKIGVAVVAEDRAVAGGLGLDPAERGRSRHGARVPRRAEITRSEAGLAPASQRRRRRHDPINYLAHLPSNLTRSTRNEGILISIESLFCFFSSSSVFFYPSEFQWPGLRVENLELELRNVECGTVLCPRPKKNKQK